LHTMTSYGLRCTRPTGRTRPVSTIPATPAETTGEILLTWGLEGPAVTAPDQAAIPALELFGMRRVPGDPRVVELRARSATGSAPRTDDGRALCICIACSKRSGSNVRGDSSRSRRSGTGSSLLSALSTARSSHVSVGGGWCGAAQRPRGAVPGSRRPSPHQSGRAAPAISGCAQLSDRQGRRPR
jgi:hypothetical protein